jgi:SET domain-containing protein
MKKNSKLPKVFVKSSKVHGLGLFAAEKIAWGKRIIDYAGEVISNKEEKRRSRFYHRIGVTYVFGLDDERSIDGMVGGNESRFINHEKANPTCVPIRLDGKIWIFSYVDIAAGEELTFDYGFDV